MRYPVAVTVEDELAALHRAGDLQRAATRTIEAYGPEVLGFLARVLRDEDTASEVFAQSCEDLWTGLARFEGRASFRTWFYAIAHHAASKFRRSPHERRGRHESLSEARDAAEQVRTQTLLYLRTEVKDRLSTIRESLSADDQLLLVLRVDRRLSFRDIAMILEDTGRLWSPDEQAKVAARLRKRFQVVKDDIRDRARAAGLFGDNGHE